MKKICSIMLGALLSASAVFASGCTTQTTDGPYNITINATEGGRVTVPINQVNFGENVSISVKPNTGYRVKEFKINGEKISIVKDSYTEYCVTEDLLIEVVFDSKYTTVSFDTDGRDTISNKKFTIDANYTNLPVATSNDPDDLFMGWYTAPDGKGDYVVNSSRVPEEAHTLYAHFVSKYVVDGATLNKALYEEYSLAVTYYDEWATSLGVSYHTAEECYYPVIQYVQGKVDSFDGLENIQEVACKKNSTQLDWRNAGVLENLLPETEYSLRIGDRGSRLYGKIYHFKTNPYSYEQEEAKFLFMGNTKQATSGYDHGDTAFAKTYNTATQFFAPEEMDFLIHGGDYTSSGLMPEYWAGMFDAFKDSAFDMPIVPVAGDMEHQSKANRKTNVFENMFNIDVPAQTKSHGLYYSFSLGRVHVSVLNSNDCINNHKNPEDMENLPQDEIITGTGSLVDQQLNWLKNDLKSTREINPFVKWNIVVMHESLLLPVYAGTDDNSLKDNHANSLREQLMKVFKEQKVDLVFSAQDGELFTTNPLVYSAEKFVNENGEEKNGIAIQPIAGQKAGKTVYEKLIKTVGVTGTPITYDEKFSVLSFDGYQSGEMGTIFHQVGAVGLGKTSNFQKAKMAENLACYGNIYNNLASGIQNGKEFSMFSAIELNENTLTLRTFGVEMGKEYTSLEELEYFGGIQLKKA